MSEVQERTAAVAHFVRELRSRIRIVSRGASVAEIARLTGFKNETVRRYLTNTTPSLPFIMKVCEVWELNANWLLFGQAPRYALDLDPPGEPVPASDASVVAGIARLLERAGYGRSQTPVAFRFVRPDASARRTPESRRAGAR